MPFEHRIIQDDDPAWLDCENVEALDGLEVLADQLRDDARYLAVRYPVDSSAVGGREHSAAAQGDVADAGQIAIDQQKARCLSRVNELLADRKRTARAEWLKRLAGGAAVAIVAVVCTAIVWRIQVAETVNRDLPAGISVVPSTSQLSGAVRAVDHSSRERFRPGLSGNDPFFVSTPGMTASSVHPTPVVLELPAVFRSASEPEMEGLLDLYDTETAGPVTIGF